MSPVWSSFPFHYPCYSPLSLMLLTGTDKGDLAAELPGLGKP